MSHGLVEHKGSMVGAFNVWCVVPRVLGLGVVDEEWIMRLIVVEDFNLGWLMDLEALV